MTSVEQVKQAVHFSLFSCIKFVAKTLIMENKFAL
jgi:hypothetical protein